MIGVAVATFKGGQNLNFAIPSQYLTALIPTIKTPVDLPKAAEARKAKKEKSILDDMGGRSTDGVTGETFTWDSITQSGDFSLSLHNRLRESVKDVYCLVIIYDPKGSPIDFALIQYNSSIPPGLAKRVKGRVEEVSEQLNSPPQGGYHGAHPSWHPPRTPRSKIEIRILYFDIINPDEPVDEQSRAPGRPGLPRKSDTAAAERRNPSSLEDAEAELRELEKRLAESAARVAPAGAGPNLIESRIEDEFEGWDGETIFKLANGQIWQQATYAYTYHYAYRPKVTIIKTHGAYKMKVDGVSGTIFVKRLK